MDLYESISRLAVALGIGLLIGLERGWRRRGARPGSRAAGIRTFAISGLLGGVTAALAQALPKQELGGAASLAGGVVLGVRRLQRRHRPLHARREPGQWKFLGNDSNRRHVDLCARGLCAARRHTHCCRRGGRGHGLAGLARGAALVLLAMTFIALPILPNEPLGPFGGVNPRRSGSLPSFSPASPSSAMWQ
jgi:hypothetical protein